MEFNLTMMVAETVVAGPYHSLISKRLNSILGLSDEWDIKEDSRVKRVIFYNGKDNWSHEPMSNHIQEKIFDYLGNNKGNRFLTIHKGQLRMPSFVPTELCNRLCSLYEPIKLDGIDVILNITGCDEASYHSKELVFVEPLGILEDNTIDIEGYNIYLEERGFPTSWRLTGTKDVVKVNFKLTDNSNYSDAVWPTVLPLAALRELEEGPMLMHVPTPENYQYIEKHFLKGKDAALSVLENIDMVMLTLDG